MIKCQNGTANLKHYEEEIFMKYALMNTLVKLDGSTQPFSKFNGWLTEVNSYMSKIGPAVAGIAIAICVLMICLSDQRGTKEYIKKIVIITIAVSLLANITLLLAWGSNVVKYFFS